MAPCPPDSTAVSSAATATTVLPLPTSPCKRRRIGLSERMSARTSAATRSWAPRQAEGQALQERVQQGAVPGVPGARLGLLDAGLADGEAGLDEKELVEDEPPQRGLQARLVAREVDLVHRVVQVRQTVLRE